MRVPSSLTRRKTTENSSMTPMIDVVFLLLIFFVCASAGQVAESMLPTELSAGSVQTDETIEQTSLLGDVRLRLRQDEAGNTVVFVKERTFTNWDRLAETLTLLAETAPELPVILDTAPQVPVGDMIRTYDLCRAAGFESILFATDPRRLPAPPSR